MEFSDQNKDKAFILGLQESSHGQKKVNCSSKENSPEETKLWREQDEMNPKYTDRCEELFVKHHELLNIIDNGYGKYQRHLRSLCKPFAEKFVLHVRAVRLKEGAGEIVQRLSTCSSIGSKFGSQHFCQTAHNCL